VIVVRDNPGSWRGAERMDAERMDAERMDAERMDAERMDAERYTRSSRLDGTSCRLWAGGWNIEPARRTGLRHRRRQAGS
jgi:hypothetical protein